MILMIDNYDSFVYNVVQYIGKMGHEVKVFRNDKVTVKELEKLNPKGIVISPGPCSPKEAGVSNEVIEVFAGKVPILGICLGMQCIGEVFGAKIKKAMIPKHGKMSEINHDGQGVFKAITNPVEVVRYHSLIIENESLPVCLEGTAYSDKGELMGVRHTDYQVEGVQFHPESVFTQQGQLMINNFLDTIK